MTDQITVTGVVATTPRAVTTTNGTRITSFRLASQLRRYDRTQGKWVDGTTNWFSVAAFRRLAEHTADSLQKGERVLVHGRLRIRDWENGERTGTVVEIEADAIGHDLAWGCSSFTRSSDRSEVREDGSPDSVPPESEPSGDVEGPPPAMAPGEIAQQETLVTALPF